MKETQSTGPSVVEPWIKFVDTTMAGYKAIPSAQTPTRTTQSNGEDPWIALIDQLWQTNPSSNMVPIDYGEILRVFQQIWLDTFSNPAHFFTCQRLDLEQRR